MDEPEQIRILLVDDDQSFCVSTQRILCKEGFPCDCASDGDSALALLANSDYGLLIADINMPGNSHLELIVNISNRAANIPVILVTGYPSAETAITAVGLPVIAYICKPFDRSAFMNHVRSGIELSKNLRSVKQNRVQLEDWVRQLNEIESDLLKAHNTTSRVSVPHFFSLKMRHIYGALADMQNLISKINDADEGLDACYLIDCPPRASLIAALNKTIGTLQETRKSFKSKQLEALRQELEKVVDKFGGAYGHGTANDCELP